MRRTLPRGRVHRGSPYLAGGPARNWHLAGSAPVGCRGFNGPVPPPLLIVLFSWRDGTKPAARPSRPTSTCDQDAAAACARLGSSVAVVAAGSASVAESPDGSSTSSR